MVLEVPSGMLPTLNCGAQECPPARTVPKTWKLAEELDAFHSPILACDQPLLTVKSDGQMYVLTVCWQTYSPAGSGVCGPWPPLSQVLRGLVMAALNRLCCSMYGSRVSRMPPS